MPPPDGGGAAAASPSIFCIRMDTGARNALATFTRVDIRKWRRVLAAWLAASLAPALAGCAITTTHANGTRTVLGFMYLSLPAPPPGAPDLAASMRARTLGLGLSSTETGSVLAVGWVDTTVAFSRGNACLGVDPRQ